MLCLLECEFERGGNLKVQVLTADATLHLQNKKLSTGISDFMKQHFFGKRVKRTDARRFNFARKSSALTFARSSTAYRK